MNGTLIAGARRPATRLSVLGRRALEIVQIRVVDLPTEHDRRTSSLSSVGACLMRTLTYLGRAVHDGLGITIHGFFHRLHVSSPVLRSVFSFVVPL